MQAGVRVRECGTSWGIGGGGGGRGEAGGEGGAVCHMLILYMY